MPLLKYFNVWNVEQCEGVKLKPHADLLPTANHDPIAAAEAIIANMPQRPEILHGQQEAWYRPVPRLWGCLTDSASTRWMLNIQICTTSWRIPRGMVLD